MKSPGEDLHDLSHYALGSMSLGRLTGVSIANHAIPDAFLLMHVGVGCKNKATAHLLSHDWAEHGNVREAWTEVGDRDLILGSSTRAAPYMRSWVNRMNPSILLMVSVTFIDLAGEDLKDVVARAAKDLPCPVALLPAPGFSGDMYSGYATVLHAITQRIDWTPDPARDREVTLIGYLFDRYEADHLANLSHLKKLLGGIGLKLASSPLTGRPLAETLDAGGAGTLVELPYMRPLRKRIRKSLGGRESVETDLPMGIAGTSRWLREVGAAAGVDATQTDAFIARREESTRSQLRFLMDRWRGLRMAIFAEPPLAAGLASMLGELGMLPCIIGLKGTSLGGRDAFVAAVEADGVRLPEDVTILENPSLAQMRSEFVERMQSRALDGVLGSATDLNVLTTIPADEVGRAGSTGPLLLEIGFPCRDHHAIQPMPFLGYSGVVVQAQRIASARRLWDTGRDALLP